MKYFVKTAISYGAAAAVGAGIGGAYGAGVSALTQKYMHRKNPDYKLNLKKMIPDVATSAYIGAILGAGFKRTSPYEQFKHNFNWDGFYKRYKYYQAKPQSTESLSTLIKKLGLKNVPNTKKEINRAYRAASRKAHPDLGGNTKAQQRLNSVMEKIRYTDEYKILKEARLKLNLIK